MKLETLVNRLATGIKNFDRDICNNTLEHITAHEDCKYGNKQQIKDSLFEALGYDRAKGKARGNLHTITNNHFFLRDIDVKDIGKVITQLPQVLGYDIEKLQSKVDYLLSLGVAKDNIGKIVTRLPAVLELDIEKNLKPTSKYLIDTMDCSVEDIVRAPALLSYSLELRIKPRYEFFRSKGLTHYKASSLLIPPDKKLMKRTNQDLDEFNAFKIKHYDQLIPSAIKEKDYRLALDACTYAMDCTKDPMKLNEYQAKKKEIQGLQKAA